MNENLRALLSGSVLVMLPAVLPCQAADTAGRAEPDTAVSVTFGGFVDGYYAYDFDRPPDIDRSFTTQPARHDEFNINLAFVEANLASQRYRGRLAVQYGTSVQSNYAGEPRIGTVSGPDVARFIQEAYAGVRLASTLWVDGGIFFSHIGSETWVSRDSWTYTRSLIAEFSPYYETGVRATWEVTPRLVATGVVVNGWQNISETNSDKAVGIRLDFALTPRITLTYDNLLGNEAPDTARSRLRTFHEVIAKYADGAYGLLLTVDAGTQRRPSDGGTSTWYGAAAIGKYRVTQRVALSGRVEYYGDPDQVIVAAPAAEGFRAWGGSVGVDVQPAPRIFWRTELRAFRARHEVFPERSGAGDGDTKLAKGDGFVVTSLGLTF